MTLFRTVEPAVEPVTLVEAKASLRIDHASEDELIAGLIRAARQEVEARAGLALIDQNWRLALDAWPRCDFVALMRHPVRQVLSVTVFGQDGEGAVIDPAAYQLDAMSRPARLLFRERPAPERRMNGIEIDFSAEFGEAGTDVPDLLKRAVLLLVAHWWEFRAAFGTEMQPVSIPPTFDRLIAPYVARRL